MTVTDSPGAWQRVLSLFHQALERSPSERTALVESVRQEDPALADELLSLLAAHDGAGPIAQLDSPPPVTRPARIGPYRLTEMLGVGGMGVVYRAEREADDFTQRVALKLIRAGYVDPLLEERLRRERRILARLEHPGIARFIDGGTTETGQSYFAMEFVEGSTLLDYSAANQLSIEERIRLFQEVCHALQYAHQQLVIHGDLKPGNIMVTPDGRPKLLDFGIAELMDATGHAGSHTRSVPWFTPDYASPEQIRSERLTTQTDVYALGVVLYELLVGKRPYEVWNLRPVEMEQVICEVEPQPPSQVADTPAARRELAGDLDTIVLHAMAKEPARRYASAEHLAADLERFLEGRPVKARPDSRRYRFGKFVQRHRTLVTALVLLFLSLGGGMAAVTWQAAVARRQRDAAETARRESEAVTGFLMELFEAIDPRRSGLDTLTVTSLLRHGLDRANTLDHQPLLQARLLDALARVHQGMGRHDDARDLFQRSLALQHRHLPPRDPAMGQSYIGLALNYRQENELALADSLITLALRLEREGLDPSNPIRIRGLLAAANIAVATAELPKGEQYSREALTIARATLPAGDPLLSESIRVMGSLLVRQGKTAEALETYQEYVDLNRRAHGASHPITATTMVHLGNVYELTLGRPEVAESIYREALAILEPAWGTEHPGLIHSRESLARVLSRRGAYAAAESLQRANLNTVIRYSGRETAAVAHSLAGVSYELLMQGKVEPAARMAEEALALHRRTTRPDDPDIASTMFILARCRLAQHRSAEALELGRQGIALRQRAYGPRHQLVAISFEFLAMMHRELGQRALADSLFTRALAIIEQVGGPNHADYIRVKRLLSENREPGAGNQ